MSVICVFVVGLMVCSVTGIVVFEYCTVGSLCRGELHGSYRMSIALWVCCVGENYMVVTE